MLAYYLDGRSFEWRIKGIEVTKDKRPRSALHKKARELLKERFPTLQILEEVPVTVEKGKTLYFDFFLPLREIAIEVHGQQHYEKSSAFHNTTADFIKQQINDNKKAEWCEINGVKLVVLRYDEVDQWSDQI